MMGVSGRCILIVLIAEEYEDALKRLRTAAMNVHGHHVGAVGDGRLGESEFGDTTRTPKHRHLFLSLKLPSHFVMHRPSTGTHLPYALPIIPGTVGDASRTISVQLCQDPTSPLPSAHAIVSGKFTAASELHLGRNLVSTL